MIGIFDLNFPDDLRAKEMLPITAPCRNFGAKNIPSPFRRGQHFGAKSITSHFLVGGNFGANDIPGGFSSCIVGCLEGFGRQVESQVNQKTITWPPVGKLVEISKILKA